MRQEALCRQGRERRLSGRRADLGPTAACHEQQLSGTADPASSGARPRGFDTHPSRYSTEMPMRPLLIANAAPMRWLMDSWRASDAAQRNGRALPLPGTRDFLQQFQQHVSLALAQVSQDLVVRLQQARER